MTDLLDRPPAPSRSEAAARAPLPPASRVLVEALVAVARSAGVVLAVLGATVLVLWVTDPNSSGGAGQAARVAGLLWLLAHGVPLHAAGTVDVIPLTVTAASAWLLYRAARRMGRLPASADPLGALIGWVTLLAAYAVVGVLVAAQARTPGVHASPAVAAAVCAAFAAVVGGIGVLRGTPWGITRLGRVPPPAVAALAAGSAAASVLLVAGTLAVLGAAASGWGRVAAMGHAVAPTPSGTVGLALLHLAVLPDAAVWAMAVAVGPGFGVGTGSWLSVAGVRAAPVPSFPLLGALPDGPTAPAALRLLFLASLLAGVVAGLVAWRRSRAGAGGNAVLVGAVLGAALVAGLVAGLLAAASSGSVGAGRMAHVGPQPALVGAATVAWIAGAGLATALVAGPLATARARRTARLAAVRSGAADPPADLVAADLVAADDLATVPTEVIDVPAVPPEVSDPPPEVSDPPPEVSDVDGIDEQVTEAIDIGATAVQDAPTRLRRWFRPLRRRGRG